MQSVIYNKQKYYLLSEDLKDELYDFQKKKLSKQKVLEAGFDNEEEMIDCLKKIILKNQKNLTYDQTTFRQLLTDVFNHQGHPITYQMTKELIKGINIQTIKKKDLVFTLKQLDVIRLKHFLEYKHIQIKILESTNKNSFPKGVRWCLDMPYGKIEKDKILIVPILAELIYSHL